MTVLSIAQARQKATAAGFTDGGLDTIVAIAQAESGFNTQAVNAADPNGGSFGILQINGVHFGSGITQAQAFDPDYSFRYAYELSQGGTNFSAWSTYTSGAYKSTAAWKSSSSGQTSVAQQVATTAASVSLWGPAQSLKAWPWLTKDGVSFPISNPYNGTDEPGVDIPTPFHTTITSLTSGHVIRAFFGTDINPAYQFGGVVLIASVIPGHPGVQAVYYQHLDEIHVKDGDIITVGQDIALSGGQTTGGEHPNSTKFSSGPHTEVGVNNPNYQAEGGAPGPNFNPTPWINSLLQKGPPVGDQVGSVASELTGQYAAKSIAYAQALSNQLASGSGPVGDNFASIESRLDAAMQFVPIDWQTITSGVNWWQVLLPWQWSSAANQVESNVSTALLRDASALALRILVILAGFILLTAFLWGVTSAALKATGTDKVIQQAAGIATKAAAAGAV